MRRTFIPALLSLGLLAGCGDAEADGSEAGAFLAAGGEAGSPVGTGRGTVAVIDTQGFGQPMPALDVALPPGWSFESAVRWDGVNGQCSQGVASPMFRMTSPDGRASIELLPGFVAATSDQEFRRKGAAAGDFCVVAQVGSGEQLARQVALPFLRPQGRLISIEPIALDPVVAQTAQRIEAARVVPGMRNEPYMLRAEIELPDGTREAIVLGGIVISFPPLMPQLPPNILNQNMVSFAWRAPPERMAETEALARRTLASIRFRPEWKRQADAIAQQRTRPAPIQANNGGGGGAGGGYSGAAGYGGGGGTDMNAWRAGQAADDAAQTQRIQSIREEETCANGDVVSIHTGC